MQRLFQHVYETIRRPLPALRTLKGQILTFFELVYPTFNTTRASSTPIQDRVDNLYQSLQSAPRQNTQNDRQQIRRSLLHITQQSEILPRQVFIDAGQVTLAESNIMLQAPNSDIFFGSVGHRPVSFKRYRIARSGSQATDRRDALIKATINEVVMLSSLSNPRIVPFEGLYQVDGTWERTYLAHALYNTVRGFLSARPDAERKPLLKDVVDGIAYLHDNGVLYGGLSGATALVDANTGRAYLSDFSQAQLELEGTLFAPTSLIQSMMEPVSLAWLAPERLGGLFEDICAGPTRSSDIYALGCFAYLIFTGKDPFEELMTGSSTRSIFRIITAVCNDNCRPARPGAGDDAFVRHGLTEVIWVTILEACWVRDPHSRPDAAELVRRLSTSEAVIDAGNV